MSSVTAVIDYGMGNLHSVQSALVKAGASDVVVTSDLALIEAADRVVFPGVGAIKDCLSEFRGLGCEPVLREVISRGTPVLAICVGMQSLMTHSEENGGVDALDVFSGSVRLFDKSAKTENDEAIKVPHMGWNTVTQLTPHPLWDGIPDQSYFYFVHSYFVPRSESSDALATVNYGVEAAAVIGRGNVFATQFHPEKSHDHGLQLLSNFLTWDGTC